MPPEPFNPNEHTIRLSGKDYLPVAWRLVWLREQHPDAAINTLLVEHDAGKHAVVHALIDIPGGGSASGFGSETKGDFNDYLEKAETKAIGRALAALGFGTQFAPEMDDGASVDRPVDSPVARGPRPRSTANGQTVGQRGGGPLPATENDWGAVRELAARLNEPLPDTLTHEQAVVVIREMGARLTQQAKTAAN